MEQMSPEALVGNLGYRELKGYIIESTGLAFYLDKDLALADKISKRLLALNLSGCSEYLNMLRDGGAGDVELDELITDLTIGETYFFRHEEQFDLFRRIVMPAILQKNAARRQLRIWSAGCSIGAEAYTVSVILKREFGVQLAGWDVSVVGTDINRQFLAQAREGRYGDWALRGLDEETKSACFNRAADSWRILDTYKEGVSFQYHNLVKNPYPSLFHNLAAFDVIFCRNVMIYFSRELIKDSIQRFHGSLVDRGWLIVGHAEINPDLYRRFRTISGPGAVLFERSEESIDGFSWPAVAVEPAPAGPPPWQPPSLGDLPLLSKHSNESSDSEVASEGPAGSLSVQIRELADRAQWPAASDLCETLISRDKLNPVGHFYHGLILEQMGRVPEATEALNRAIYLDRDFVLAHYHKGLLLQKGQETAAAVRSFINVLNVLQRMAPDKVFSEADGISAGDLAELAQMQIEVLQTP